jgi:hypothetical protein
VNSTQGGQNVLIYGIPTEIREHGMLDPIWGQGNQIYRVGFDGQQMNLLENIAETTGIGVGVHTVIFPDASGLFGLGGQKDVVAFFPRATGPRKRGHSGLPSIGTGTGRRRSRGQLVPGRQSPDHQLSAEKRGPSDSQH